MKRLNLSLTIGLSIIAAIIFIMLFPQRITRVNPYLMESTRKISTGYSLSLEGAPFAPSSQNILGTDEMGRDVFSFLIYGTRLTISLAFLVVVGRFLVAIPLGLSAGFGSFVARSLINQFSGIFSAIPSLIISAMVLKMDFFTGLFKGQSILAFVIVLTFVGWSRIASIITERVEAVMRKPFVRGEVAIGKSYFQIALQNVIPHLMAELVVLFFMEMALALTIIMQLAIFGVFIGNLRIITNTDSGAMTAAALSFEPEWAGMIASGRGYLRTAPWMVLTPALAFFLSILGFNLVGEGLRIKLQEKNSTFIVNIRRILSLDRRLLSSRGFKVTSAAVAAVFLIVLGARALGIGKTSFNLEKSESLFKGSFESQVVLGSPEAERTSRVLADSLKEMGFEPLKEEMGYFMEFESQDVFASLSSSLVVKREEGDKVLSQGRDYSIDGFGDFDLKGEIYDGREESLFTLRDYTLLKDKFILLDGATYSEKARDYFSEKLTSEAEIRGILWIAKKGEKLQDSAGTKRAKKPVIYLTREASEYFLGEKAEVNFSLRSGSYSGRGRNVLGILRGQDEKLSEEAIFIGMGYNYMEEDSLKGKKRILMGLELARKLSLQKENRSRSIIFAFWDGNIDDSLNGVKHYAENTIFTHDKSVLYIDLSNIGDFKSDRIYLSTEQAPFTKYFGWIFGHKLETALKEDGYNVVDYKNSRNISEIVKEGAKADEAMYYKASIPTVIVKLEDEGIEGDKPITLENLGEVLFDSIIQNSY